MIYINKILNYKNHTVYLIKNESDLLKKNDHLLHMLNWQFHDIKTCCSIYMEKIVDDSKNLNSMFIALVKYCYMVIKISLCTEKSWDSRFVIIVSHLWI